MSIKRILNNIESVNLVPKVKRRNDGEDELLALGALVIENDNDNNQSMNDWEHGIEEGMEVAKLETKGNDYPWEDAANFKSPMILEAVRQFGDRAKTEIMKSDKLVACATEGMEGDEINAAINRIEKHMNWQINTEMPDWRENHTRALYTLAAQGAFFKKTLYDATEGCNKSRLVKYPNFSLHQDCESLQDSNFTEYLYYKPNDIFERKAAGIWDISSRS